MSTINVNNLTIGAAEIYFAEGAAKTPTATVMTASTVKLGNITVSEIVPDVTYVEHYISVKGQRRKDKEVAVTKGLSVPFTFDELTASNFTKFVLGSDIGTKQTKVMGDSILEGRAVVDFQTDVGKDFRFVIPKCNLKADGGLTLNSDDWISGNFILEVLYSDTYHVEGSLSQAEAPYGYVDYDPNSAISIASVF